MMPMAPAFETADASWARAMYPIGAWRIGCSTPRSSVTRVWIVMTIHTRVTELLGVEHPILQAPMGYIARAQLASAVSNAGAMGIIETSSGQLDQVSDEIRKM